MLAHAPAAEFDAGPRDSGGGSERLCIATRATRPVGELIRFVVGPNGEVVPDLKQKLPGRGVWVTGKRTALADAVRRKAFAKGFRRDVKVPADLVDLTELLLARAALDALAVAGKAGTVKSGFTKVQQALEREPVVALLHAADAADDGVRKIEGLARRRFSAEAGTIPVVSVFTSAQLDLALGRSNVVHAALLAGPASATFLARCSRHECFRAGDTGNRRQLPTAERDCPEDTE